MAFYGKIRAMIIVYGIPNCDTVKKARAWLTAQGLPHTFHDFKKQGVPGDRLPVWVNTVGFDKLINRHGTTWRKLDDTAQASAATSQGAQALMLTNPSLIKRPVVEWQGMGAVDLVTVGFDSPRWAEITAK